MCSNSKRLFLARRDFKYEKNKEKKFTVPSRMENLKAE
jgi:hypothetical protein